MNPRDAGKKEYYGPKSRHTVTPEGHTFIPYYEAKLYQCCFCSVIKQTRRSKSEFMTLVRKLGDPPPLPDDARWTLAIPECVPLSK